MDKARWSCLLVLLCFCLAPCACVVERDAGIVKMAESDHVYTENLLWTRECQSEISCGILCFNDSSCVQFTVSETAEGTLECRGHSGQPTGEGQWSPRAVLYMIESRNSTSRVTTRGQSLTTAAKPGSPSSENAQDSASISTAQTPSSGNEFSQDSTTFSTPDLPSPENGLTQESTTVSTPVSPSSENGLAQDFTTIPTPKTPRSENGLYQDSATVSTPDSPSPENGLAQDSMTVSTPDSPSPENGLAQDSATVNTPDSPSPENDLAQISSTVSTPDSPSPEKDLAQDSASFSTPNSVQYEGISRMSGGVDGGDGGGGDLYTEINQNGFTGGDFDYPTPSYSMPQGMQSFPNSRWLNMSCRGDFSCEFFENNAKCFNGRCLCTPGFFYSLYSDNCKSDCWDHYLQDNFLGYDGYMLESQHWTSGLTLSACLHACLLQSPSPCHSVNFIQSKGNCSLLSFSRFDVHYSNWKVMPGCVHYQRTCS